MGNEMREGELNQRVKQTISKAYLPVLYNIDDRSFQARYLKEAGCGLDLLSKP
jgi:hypothetical protein